MTIRLVTKSLVALGFAGAMAVSFPSASHAQGFFYEAPNGARFGIGQPSRQRAIPAPLPQQQQRLKLRLGNQDWIATPAPRRQQQLRLRLGNQDYIATPAPTRPAVRRPELVVRVPLNGPRANAALPNGAGADSALAKADRAIRRAGGSWSIQ
jgi:hypothetical protein